MNEQGPPSPLLPPPAAPFLHSISLPLPLHLPPPAPPLSAYSFSISSSSSSYHKQLSRKVLIMLYSALCCTVLQKTKQLSRNKKQKTDKLIVHCALQFKNFMSEVHTTPHRQCSSLCYHAARTAHKHQSAVLMRG